MAQLLTIGPRGYVQVQAGATATMTPLFDRAAIITQVDIRTPSAADSWTFSVGGRELFRTRVNSVANNNFLGQASAVGVPNNNLFPWLELIASLNMRIPVPNGQTLTVASVGGATADIVIEFMEVDVTDTPSGMLNHYLGNQFVMPIELHLAAQPAVAGLVALDTQVAPAWVPSLISNAPIPPGFRITLYAMWLQAEGRNTFSGAANHQSTTLDLRVTKNGEQLFTRAALGLPLVGQASAGGSANSVFEERSNLFPPFQRDFEAQQPLLLPAIVINAGDTLLWQHDLSGDLTGGADYSPASVQLCALVERLGS